MLLQLLAVSGLHFEPLGNMVDSYGRREPAVAELTRSSTRSSHSRGSPAAAGRIAEVESLPGALVA